MFNPGSDTEGHRCVAPGGALGGVDPNEFYGLSEQIVTAFCPQVDTGVFWAPAAIWFMNTHFESIPPDFAPAGATPLEDFLAKFLARSGGSSC